MNYCKRKSIHKIIGNNMTDFQIINILHLFQLLTILKQLNETSGCLRQILYDPLGGLEELTA